MKRGNRWLALLACIALASPAFAGGFAFALIGDVPYSDYERRNLSAMLRSIAEAGAEFVIHDGDIKRGSEPCSPELFRERHALLDASPIPLVFVPGDNEWVDCAGDGPDGLTPEQWLARLRGIFFRAEASLGRTRMRLECQGADPAFPEFVEHCRWSRGPLTFVTLNVPGGGNNRGRSSAPSREFVRRSSAISAWLSSSFALARSHGASAVVVVMQANPRLEAAAQGRPPPGYRDLLASLVRETRAFPGEVLLVHGDTHLHRVDRPLMNPASGTPLPNLTRVETFGYPFMGWVKVIVAPGARPPFRIEARPWPPATQTESP